MEIVALLLEPKSPFGQTLHQTATNRMIEDDYTMVKNRKIETDIMRNIVGNKTTNGAVVPPVSKFLDQKLAPLFRKFPELIPDESLTNVHPLVFSEEFVYRKNPKAAVGRKIDPRSGNFICSKGIRDTILESSSAKDYSKIGDNAQNTGIVNRPGDYRNAGQRSHNKSEMSFTRSISEQYSPGKKEGWGKSSYKLNPFSGHQALKG